MRSKNYLILCVIVAVIVALTILYGPGVAETIEGRLLGFLSTNAR